MKPYILEDVAQQDKKHDLKHKVFEEQGFGLYRVPLPCADYILLNDLSKDVIQRKAKRGIPVKKMDLLGTYTVAVDSKKDMAEIVGNICGKSHDRFRDELILAKNNGIKLYVLVENKGELIKGTKDIYNKDIKCLQDVFSWKNPRLFIMKPTKEVIGYYKNGKPRYKMTQKYPTATKGETLARAMITMQEKYGCEFVFCTPMESGERIIELLEGE